jgi:predicted site-specific integrase-resolvase
MVAVDITAANRERVSNSDWMDLAEYADKQGIGRTAAYLMAQNGTLPVPVVKIGRKYRISREAYRRLVEWGQA